MANQRLNAAKIFKKVTAPHLGGHFVSNVASRCLFQDLLPVSDLTVNIGPVFELFLHQSGLKIFVHSAN